MVLDASLLRFKMYRCWRSPDCSIDDLMLLYLEKKQILRISISMSSFEHYSFWILCSSCKNKLTTNFISSSIISREIFDVFQAFFFIIDVNTKITAILRRVRPKITETSSHSLPSIERKYRCYLFYEYSTPATFTHAISSYLTNRSNLFSTDN